jgi:4-hydroxy-3-methylbut-2-enyl diphosphate reductase
VERAIEIVERALEQHGAPVYVRKQIVHNAHVVAELESRGAIFVEEIEEVPEGATVVFSAHGVSPAVRAHASARGMNVIDATCPLVAKVHGEARRFAERGYTIVLVGHEGHEEVEGTRGEAPDAIELVDDVEGVERLEVDDPQRVAFLTQTTLAVDETNEVVDALRERFPSLAGPRSDDICYATQNRQDAVKALVPSVDAVIVVGSPNSSNSNRLREVAAHRGIPAWMVDRADELRPEWIEGRKRVGVTAGASAPEVLVQQVIARLKEFGAQHVTELTGTAETIVFPMPKGLAGEGHAKPPEIGPRR